MLGAPLPAAAREPNGGARNLRAPGALGLARAARGAARAGEARAPRGSPRHHADAAAPRGLQPEGAQSTTHPPREARALLAHRRGSLASVGAWSGSCCSWVGSDSSQNRARVTVPATWMWFGPSACERCSGSAFSLMRERSSALCALNLRGGALRYDLKHLETSRRDTSRVCCRVFFPHFRVC